MKVETEKDTEFEFVYKRHFYKIYVFCCNLIYDKQQSLDITQDTFHRLWEKWDSEQYDERSTIAFLHVTARNLCYDTLRNYHPTETLNEQLQRADDTTAFLDELTLQETRRHVKNAVNTLLGRKRDIIDLAIRGKNNTEIAELLHISVNTVKTLKKDAYAKLRLLLENEYYFLVCLFIVKRLL